MNITPIDDCGCNGPKLMLNEGKSNILLSEGLSYHVQEGRMLIHNIYRPLSSNYMALFREARALYNEGILSVVEDDAELLESNLGEYGIYEGIRVPLDYPISLDELIELHESQEIDEAEFKGKKVSFGDTSGLSAKLSNPKARQAFAARHDCKNKKDRTKASYWSCRLPRYAKMLGFKTTFSGYW